MGKSWENHGKIRGTYRKRWDIHCKWRFRTVKIICSGCSNRPCWHRRVSHRIYPSMHQISLLHTAYCHSNFQIIDLSQHDHSIITTSSQHHDYHLPRPLPPPHVWFCCWDIWGLFKQSHQFVSRHFFTSLMSYHNTVLNQSFCMITRRKEHILLLFYTYEKFRATDWWCQNRFIIIFFYHFFFIMEFPPLSFIYRFFIICGLTLQTWSFCWFCLLPLYNCRWVYMEREKDRYKIWILFLLLIVDPTVLTLLHYFGLCYIVCTTCFTYPYENVFGFITSWTSDHRMP